VRSLFSERRLKPETTDGILLISCAAMFALFFILDASTPIGYPINFLYFIPVSLTLILRRPAIHFYFALVATILSIIALPIKPPGDLTYALFNRPVSIVAFWMLAYIIDRTKRSQNDFEETNNRFMIAKDAAQIGIYEWDLRSGDIKWDSRVRELWGVGEDEPIVADTLMKGVHPDDRGPLQSKIDEALNQSEDGDFHTEYRVVNRKDHATRWIETTGTTFFQDGKASKVIGTIEDITEEKQAEEKIHSLNDRFEMAQRAAGVGVWDWDIRTGRMEWTQEMFVLFGLDPRRDSATFETWDAVLHPEDRQIAHDRIEMALRDHTFLDSEYRLVQPKGHIIWINALGHGEYDPLDQPIRMTGICINITKRKEAEEALKQSNAELQQFAYVASHDLQEPLRMVISYLSLINKKYGEELNPKAKEYMSYAVEGGERMRQLVNDLLQYSRIETMGRDFTPVDMNKVAENVKNDLHMAINESGATLIIEPLPLVIADKTQMTQLLTNLVSNAVKFHNHEVPRIEISVRSRRSEFIFAVKDNGIGIDPKYQDRLFKMFQRLHTQDEYPGTGIGLAIAKKIVEHHGGRIWFESELGKGATFFFSLPLRRVGDLKE
jgi:PAS domain S-box-containing protein